jgi:hypothetical protein
MSAKIFTYSELRQHLGKALRSQHPEWIEANGASPICDSYDIRFAKLLEILPPPEVSVAFKIVRIEPQGSSRASKA